MKKIFLGALSILLANCVIAQTNYFNTSGNVGLGTSSPSALLTLNYQYAQIKLQGASQGWLGSDLVLSRTSSTNQLFRSPNILFLDEATNTASYIQSYQGNLQFWPGGTQTLTLLNGANGAKVGVGVSTPYSTLQVEAFSSKLNIASASSLGGSSYIGFNAAKLLTNGNWHFDTNGTIDGGAVIYADMNGNINFAAIPNLNNNNYAELTDDQLKSRIYFQISSTGLARAKQLKIETTGWPDFVFSKGYKLPTLRYVESYINQNQHLPDMPAAAEVVKGGIDVGEMNRLMMKKIEELTLYVINQQKQIRALQRGRVKTDKHLKR